MKKCNDPLEQYFSCCVSLTHFKACVTTRSLSMPARRQLQKYISRHNWVKKKSTKGIYILISLKNIQPAAYCYSLHQKETKELSLRNKNEGKK